MAAELSPISEDRTRRAGRHLWHPDGAARGEAPGHSAEGTELPRAQRSLEQIGWLDHGTKLLTSSILPPGFGL